MDWTWQPFFAPEAIALATAAGLVAAGAAYALTRQRNPTAALTLFLFRAAALGLLAVCLGGPSRMPPPLTEPARPTLDLWLDTSASMQVEDMDGLSRIRFAAERWLTPDSLARLGSDVQVRAFSFDENTQPLALDSGSLGLLAAEGSATRIVRNLTRRLGELPQDHRAARAVLLLSDGIDSDGIHPAPLIAAARARGIPIHTVPLGGPRLEQDLSVLARPLQDLLIAGESGSIQIQIFQTNVGRRRVALHIDDGHEPQVRELEFQGEPYLTLDLPVRHEAPGTYAYALRVEPLPREVELRNNHQTLYLEVSPRRFRVLMAEGEAGWDTKYLAQSLRSDPRIELLQVSQLSATRRETLATRIPADEATFPDTLEQLARFDAVILGRAPHRVAGENWLGLLRPFVEDNGGGLLWLRGPPEALGLPPAVLPAMAALSPLLDPANAPSGLRLRPTPSGRMHPAFAWGLLGTPDDVITRLPPLQRAYVGRPRAAAEVLAGFSDGPADAPALLSMPVGSGRVMLFAGEGLWSWRLLPPELENFDGVYDLFWSAILRQLATSGELLPGQDIGLQLSEVNLRKGSPLAIAASRRLGSPAGELRCLVIHPSGRREQVALRPTTRSGIRFEADFTPTEEGSYTIELEAAGAQPPLVERRFNVFDLDAERLQTSARPEWLRLLARETGGELLDPRHPERLPALLALHQAALDVPIEPELIWNRAQLMLLIAGLLGLEWIIRKAKGWM